MEEQGLLPKNINLEKSSSLLKSILKVYEIYQNKTKDLNTFDFGDLILFSVKLLKSTKRYRRAISQKF